MEFTPPSCSFSWSRVVDASRVSVLHLLRHRECEVVSVASSLVGSSGNFYLQIAFSGGMEDATGESLGRGCTAAHISLRCGGTTFCGLSLSSLIPVS